MKGKIMKSHIKLFLILIELLLSFSFFAFDKSSFKVLPKTTFSVQQESVSYGKAGLAEGVETSSKNQRDVALPDKKLLRGFERFPKLDAFGDVLSDDFLFYKKILTAEQKSAYDEIYKCLMNRQDSLQIISRIKSKELNKVIEAVYYDNPEIFWWAADCSWYYNSDGTVTQILFQYLFPQSELDRINETFVSMSLPVIFYANLLETDIDKIKYIHDYLCLSIEYDYENFNAGTYGGKLQTAYSAIVEYKTVCAGYSRAFAYYMQQLHIPCTVLWGSGHAWNMIKIGGNYYQMDVTWDDGNKVPPFFNLTHSQMQKVDMHALSENSGIVVSNNPSNSSSMSYANQFGNIPIGFPYTYQEFNNIVEDIENPEYAKIIKLQ